jgi:hypothetical protein
VSQHIRSTRIFSSETVERRDLITFVAERIKSREGRRGGNGEDLTKYNMKILQKLNMLSLNDEIKESRES